MLSDTKLVELRASAPSGRGNRFDLAIRLSRLTQEHIVKSLGVTPVFVSQLKLGKRRRLTLEMANKIADCFGCEPPDLFPPEYIVQELAAVPDLARPVACARSARAGTKRPRRAPRKLPEFVYPLLCE